MPSLRTSLCMLSGPGALPRLRNIFINDQSFKSNLTSKECKAISYDRLSCGSTNVIYEYIVLIVILFKLVKLESH